MLSTDPLAGLAAAATTPFSPVSGTYFGLCADTNSATSLGTGGFTLSVTPQGRLSGVWQIAAERFTVSGRVEPNGSFTRTVRPRNGSPVTVTLQLDVAGRTPLVTGSVNNGVWTAAVTGHRAVFDGTHHPAPQAGRYTLLIPGDCSSSNAPCGDSYGTLTVSKRGAVRLSGALVDGTRFTQAAGVSPDGQWPCYAPLYSRQGWLWGWLTFTNPPAGELSGDLSWVKPPLPKEKYYPEGIAVISPAWGEAYFAAGRKQRPLSGNQVMVVLSGGALTENLSIPGTLSAGNHVKLSHPSSLSLSASTGLFRGKAYHPGTRQALPFAGVVLQRPGMGGGHFLGPEATGQVRLTTSSDTGYVAQFETQGASFAPMVALDSTFLETVAWAWSDGTVSSNSPSASKDFGSALPRRQGLNVCPAGALTAINLGFDQMDGGESTPLPLQSPQNVSAVYFPAPLPGLKYWASSYNPLTNTLDFTGFNSLEAIEAYQCPNLQHAVVAHLPSVRRICIELCDLRELDLSGDPNLEDLRAAVNHFTKIVVGEGTGPQLRHWCTRDNPQLQQPLGELMGNFFSLQVCYLWNDNQSGRLSFVSTNLMYVDVHHNQYSAIDLSGHNSLRWCVLYDNRLTNLELSPCPELEVFDVHQNRLPPAVLDRLLELLDTTAPHLVRADLSQNAGPPSSAGFQHYQNLLNRGVNVRADF